ncbi:MAG: hypothetical protein KJ597_01475 [Nanoarchaeota archaeon]|nr:hypothetical protein [Nanoarchaeota archaeon]
MNKTAIKVLQEIIRNKYFKIEDAARKLKKAKTTIYDCLAKLRKNNLLDKNNTLRSNQLTQAYKKLFIMYPYDFSFLTKNNLKILFLLDKERTFGEIIKKTKLSRYTVNQLLKQLRTRGFSNKRNKLTRPEELISLIKTIQKFQQTYYLELPPTAVIIDDNEKRTLIQATKETDLPLKYTAFSAFNIKIIVPYNYYTTKKKVTFKDVFDDAKIISKTRREKLITALFYKKNRKRLKKDKEYEVLIASKEFKRMVKDYE